MISRQFEDLPIEGSAEYREGGLSSVGKVVGDLDRLSVIHMVADTRKNVKIVPLLDSEVPKLFGQRRAFAMTKPDCDQSTSRDIP